MCKKSSNQPIKVQIKQKMMKISSKAQQHNLLLRKYITPFFCYQKGFSIKFSDHKESNRFFTLVVYKKGTLHNIGKNLALLTTSYCTPR